MLRAQTKLVFLDDFSEGAAKVADPAHALVIYDQYLPRVSPKFRAWIARFPYRYQVKSGEELKDLEAFAHHARKLSKIAEPLAPRKMTVVAVGGGSVGDFAGFFASIYKRGVALVHVPSTWLAAVDSSHGGKTALNSFGAKNQFGTFYPASRVVFVRSLLEAQPPERASEALAELAKIALIDGGSWTRSLERTRLRNEKLLWKFLRPAIESKMKIVKRDPHEKSGIRQLLNLGHTVGHVFEAAHGWAHGRAIAQGLFFALDFGVERGEISPREAERVRALLEGPCGLTREKIAALPERKIRSLLTRDKKREVSGEVTFIFLKKRGRAERTSVSIDMIVREAERQGWVR